MHKIFRSLASLVIIATLAISPAFGIHKKQLTKLQEQQHQSMHEIVMVDRDTDGEIVSGGLCTAYAVGPHTLMTAQHCDDEKTDRVYVDPVTRESVKDNTAVSYKIVSRQFDNQDHMLLDLSGANFKVTIFLSPNVRLPQQGEHVYQWGCPAGIRDQYREGVVMGSLPMGILDDTEVNAKGPLVYFIQEAIIGGDSGSAIFSAKDGALIGIVTYGLDNGQTAGVYPIQFTGAQIEASLK